MNTKQQARSLHKYLLRTRGGNEGCGQGLEPGPGAWGEGQFRPTKLSRGGRGWRRAPELGRRKGGALSLPRGPCGHLPASATVCPGPPRAKTFARTSPQLPPYLVALGKETLSIGDLGGDVKPRAQGHPTGERAADSGTHRLQGPPAPSSPRAEAGSKASASARPGRGRRSGGPRAEREVQSLRRPPGRRASLLTALASPTLGRLCGESLGRGRAGRRRPTNLTGPTKSPAWDKEP